MISNKILVDSSVWIDFFKGSKTEILEQLIQEDLVCTNELIITELIPILDNQNEKVVIEGLLAIPIVPLTIDWYLIRQMQIENLKNGVNKVGIPDLIILQQVIEHKVQFLTYDKHFKLMRGHFEFSLFS